MAASLDQHHPRSRFAVASSRCVAKVSRVGRTGVAEQTRDGTHPEPQERLHDEVAHPPGHLPQGPQPVGAGRPRPRGRPASRCVRRTRAARRGRVRSRARVTPSDENASCTSRTPPIRDAGRPAEVVAHRPVVVLAVDVEQVDRAGVRRPGLAGRRRHDLDPVGHAGGARGGASRWSRVDGAPYRQRRVERVDRDESPAGRAARTASTTVDRPWWLPISTTVLPAGSDRAASNSTRPGRA